MDFLKPGITLSNNYRKQFYYLSKVTISNLTGELEDSKGLLKQYLRVINENTLYCQFLFPFTPQTPMTTIFLSCLIFMEKVSWLWDAVAQILTRIMENEIPGMDALSSRKFTQHWFCWSWRSGDKANHLQNTLDSGRKITSGKTLSVNFA